MALWTPAGITTSLWLDASDSSTITLESGAVSQWSDKSGNARHATQSTASSRPTMSTGKIIFDGSNDWLQVQSFDLTNIAIFIVIEIGAYRSDVILSKRNDTTYSFDMPKGSAGNVYFGINSNDNRAQSTALYQNGTFLVGGDFSGSTVRVLVDGTVAGTDTYTGNITSSTTDITIGRRLMSSPNEGYFLGSVKEVLILPFADTTTLQIIEGYLAWKHGLEAKLPADHPYKSAAPTLPDLAAVLIQPYNLTDPLDAALIQPYTLADALSAWLEQPYSFLLQAWLIQHYGDARQLRSWLIQKYGSVPVLRAWLIQKYGDPLALSAWLEQPWQMSTQLLAWLSQRYGIAAGKLEAWIEQLYHLHENPQLAAALIQPYLIGDQERTTHDFQYEVSIGGVGVSPYVINWDFRRSRYYGTIELTFKRQDEALLAVDGAELVFVFGGTTYSFLIEGGWEETSDWTTVSYRVAAHSRTKQLGAPYAAPITGQVGPGMASVIFAALVEPYGITLGYEITDIYLPAIEAEDETPIDLIRRILPEQAVLQSGPEGDVLYVQWETEVPVPQWFAVAPAVTIDDLTGFVQTSETSDPQQGFNRFDIIDQQTAEDNSQLVSDQVDDQTIECRLHLSPWNDEIEFELVHTAGSQVTIEPFGVVTRNETETVEIVDGAGRTRYPIDAVIATAWKQQDLGAVTADDDGIIDAAVKRTWDAAHETYTGGDSLLAITYRTRFWRWLVRSPHIDEVQVVALRVTDEVAA